MSANTLISQPSKPQSQSTLKQGGAPKRGLLRRLASVLLIIALALAVYLLAIRPSQIRWGATDAEVARVRPGDELITHPTFDATRAVTVNAPPEAIWPWLVQWGYGRAGFYGYDLVENIGSPSGMHSADHIVPEYQHLAVGDKVKMNDLYYFCVRSIEPNRLILLAGCSDASYGTMLWALEPIDANHTRLIHRLRMQYQWLKLDIPVMLFTDVADHVAVRKLLPGFKDRVEGRVEPLANQAIELGVYLLIVIECIFAMAQILIRRQWGWWWALALFAAFTLLIALYSSAALWIKALLAISILAGLVLLLAMERRKNTVDEERKEEPWPT